MKEFSRLKMNSGKYYLFSFLLIFLSQIVNAQNYSRYNWYFGNSQYGIIFNKSDDQPNQTDTQATPFGNGASAVATDRISGDLLFYTDGEYVYDATHTIMFNWTGLNGNTSANQSVAISPKPNSPGQFFIFTNTANYPGSGNIFVSTVNMNSDGNATSPEPPLGELILENFPALVPPIQVSPGMLVFEYMNFYFIASMGIIGY